MKDKLLTIITVVLIGVLLVLLQSCKNDEPEMTPDESEVFLNKISQTWKTNRVTVDAVDVTNYFNNTTITFSKSKTYTATNAVSPIWPANGTFETVTGLNRDLDIKRNDGMVIDVVSLTESGLTLELLYTPATGRVTGVSGRYKFELIR
jgi:hypothetical protein